MKKGTYLHNIYILVVNNILYLRICIICIIRINTYSNLIHLLISLMSVYSHGHDHFGIKLTFIATRSGLLRWRDYTTNNEPISGKP